MHRKAILAVLVMLVMTTLACGINITLPENAIEVGPLETEPIFVSLPGGTDTAKLKLDFGVGKLIINPGAEEGVLVSGTATYNVAEFKPSITTSGSQVTIDQGSFDYEITGLPNFNDLENEWDLVLGSQPIELDIKAGAFDGEFELGGLALESLKVFGGASDVELYFSAPNLTPMESLRYTAGASSVRLYHLANANFTYMDFDVGVGNYMLDFSGELQRDATINIDAALSNVTIIVPAGVPASVNLGGGLTNVSTQGTWSGAEKDFSQPGNGPSLTINIDLGAGNLTLKNE